VVEAGVVEAAGAGAPKSDGVAALAGSVGVVVVLVAAGFPNENIPPPVAGAAGAAAAGAGAAGAAPNRPPLGGGRPVERLCSAGFCPNRPPPAAGAPPVVAAVVPKILPPAPPVLVVVGLAPNNPPPAGATGGVEAGVVD